MENNKFVLDKSHMATIFNLLKEYLPESVRFKLRYKYSKCFIDCFNFLNNLEESALHYPIDDPNDGLILACSGIEEDSSLNRCTIFCDGVNLFGNSGLDHFKYYFGVNQGSSVYQDCNTHYCHQPDCDSCKDSDSDSDSYDDNESYGDSCRCGESGYVDMEDYDFYEQKFFGKNVGRNISWTYNKLYTPVFYEVEYSDIWESLIKMIKERKNFVKPSSNSQGSDISKEIFSLNEKYYEKDLNIYFNHKSC